MRQNQPMTMDEDAIGANEVVASYERAGFSRSEAVDLLKHHIWTNAHIAAEQARWEKSRQEGKN